MNSIKLIRRKCWIEGAPRLYAADESSNIRLKHLTGCHPCAAITCRVDEERELPALVALAGAHGWIFEISEKEDAE